MESMIDWIEMISAICIQIILRLLPWIMLNNKMNALIVATIAEIVSGLWFSLQFVVNHETIQSINVSPKNNSNYDWGMHQTINSHNYSVNSWLALHFSGGLNLQIEHHLFPSIHYKHYPYLTILVKQTCKQFNIPYYQSNNLIQGLCVCVCLCFFVCGLCINILVFQKGKIRMSLTEMVVFRKTHIFVLFLFLNIKKNNQKN